MAAYRRTKSGTDGSEVRPESVLRCDKLPSHMNRGKTVAVRSMMRDWRGAAGFMAARQWRFFERNGYFRPLDDPATDHRKAGAEIRIRILGAINARYGLVSEEPEKDKPKRLAKMIPGLVDPLAPLKESLGAAQLQMVRSQVVGMLESFVSNRMNDFVRTVFGTESLDGRTRHMLFAVNKARAWFDLGRPVAIVDEQTGKRDVVVPADVRRLARKVMSHLMGLHRRPSMKRIGMVVDQRIALLSETTKASAFPLWLSLKVGKGKRISIPLSDYAYFRERGGERKLSFQIIEDRESGRISVGVVTDVGEACARSRKAYLDSALTEAAGLDFGLSTLFASDSGDLMGRGFMAKLAKLDRTLQGIAQHVRRSGKKPKDSKRYLAHAARVRGFIRTEIRRVLNRFVEGRRPKAIYLERLDFRAPGLSRRMNRILSNCGRSVLKAKLAAMEQELGVVAVEKSPAYTSQTCRGCGYADRNNRIDQARFQCLWCGKKSHADVNAAGNVVSERFGDFGSSSVSTKRAAVLDMLTRRHVERHPMLRTKPLHGRSRGRGAPADPRLANPYFKGKVDPGGVNHCANAR